MRPLADEIDEAAAGWALRHPLSPEDRIAMDLWLAQDRRHAGALLRALAGLKAFERAHLDEVRDADESEQARPHRRRLLIGGLGAVAAAALGWVVSPRLMGERMTTTRGEIRRMPLADGSIAMIDTDSDLRFNLTEKSRRIALSQGRAWFQVAKDRARPFIVDAGVAQVFAVGTEFSVKRTGTGVEVAVTDGTVAAWARDASGAMTILHAGDYARFADASALPVVGTAPEAIARSLAWRDGEIALQGDSLASAVAQFNRYNARQLVIADRSLDHEPLVGLFEVSNPNVFAASLEATLDVTVSYDPQKITIARKKPGGA